MQLWAEVLRVTPLAMRVRPRKCYSLQLPDMRQAKPSKNRGSGISAIGVWDPSPKRPFEGAVANGRVGWEAVIPSGQTNAPLLRKGWR